MTNDKDMSGEEWWYKQLGSAYEKKIAGLERLSDGPYEHIAKLNGRLLAEEVKPTASATSSA